MKLSIKNGKKYLIKTAIVIGLLTLVIFLYSYFSNKEKIKNYLFLDNVLEFLISEENEHINSIINNMTLYSGNSIPLENMPTYMENAFDDYSLMYKNLSTITTKWENCKYENISKGTTFLKNNLDYIYSVKENIAKLKPLFNELSIVTSTMQSIQTSTTNVHLPNNIESDYFGYWTDLADKQIKLGSSIDEIYLDIKELSYSNNFNAIENIAYIDFNLKKKHQKQLYDKIELGIDKIELKKNEIINEFGTGERSMTGDLWSGLLLFKNIWINNPSVDSSISKIQESNSFCNSLKTGLSDLTDQDKKGIYEASRSHENVFKCELFAISENKKNNIDCSFEFYQDEFGNRIYFDKSWSIYLGDNTPTKHNIIFDKFSSYDKTDELIIRLKKEVDNTVLSKEDLINSISEIGNTELYNTVSLIDSNECYTLYEIKGKSLMGSILFDSNEKGNILYKKIIDKGYTVEYVLVSKSQNIEELIQNLNTFINNTKINESLEYVYDYNETSLNENIVKEKSVIESNIDSSVNTQESSEESSIESNNDVNNKITTEELNTEDNSAKIKCNKCKNKCGEGGLLFSCVLATNPDEDSDCINYTACIKKCNCD